MDLQTRKLNAIGFLLVLQDESVMSRIESTINEFQNQNKLKLKPFSQDEIIERARQSNQDYAEGKFKAQDQLEKKSEIEKQDHNHFKHK